MTRMACEAEKQNGSRTPEKLFRSPQSGMHGCRAEDSPVFCGRFGARLSHYYIGRHAALVCMLANTERRSREIISERREGR
jgi:hypothetical protein